jgi:hypothetical protein
MSKSHAFGRDDLPTGYRWATEHEAENWREVPGIIVVPRTVDSTGAPYVHGEADLAVPVVDCGPEGLIDSDDVVAYRESLVSS